MKFHILFRQNINVLLDIYTIQLNRFLIKHEDEPNDDKKYNPEQLDWSNFNICRHVHDLYLFHTVNQQQPYANEIDLEDIEIDDDQYIFW